MVNNNFKLNGQELNESQDLGENSQGSNQSSENELLTIFSGAVEASNSEGDPKAVEEGADNIKKRKFEALEGSNEALFSDIKKLKREDECGAILIERTPFFKFLKESVKVYQESAIHDKSKIETMVISAFENRSDALKNDKNSFLETLRIMGSSAFHFMGNDLKKERSSLLEILKVIDSTRQRNFFIQNFMSGLSDELKKDKEFLSEIWDEIILTEFQEGDFTTFIQCLREEFRQDKEFVIDIFKKVFAELDDLEAYSYFNAILQFFPNDDEFLFMLAKQLTDDSDFTEFMESALGDRLKSDQNFLLAFLEANNGYEDQNFWVRPLISDKLKEDKEFMMEAVKRDFRTAVILAEKFKKDHDYLLDMVEKVPKVAICLDEESELYKNLIMKWYGNKQPVFDKREDYEKFIKEAVKRNGEVISYIEGDLKRDEELVLLALEGILNREVDELEDVSCSIDEKSSIDYWIFKEGKFILEIYQDQDRKDQLFRIFGSLSKSKQYKLLFLCKPVREMYQILSPLFLPNSSNLDVGKIRDINFSFK